MEEYKEDVPEIIQTKKGLYYISKTRKIKNTPLWVGLFFLEETAIKDYIHHDKINPKI